MNKIQNLTEGLTFDDVLLLPGYCNFKREEVDLNVDLGKGIKLSLPVISSPMDTVTEAPMAIAIAQNGGLGIIHRNLNPKKQAEMVEMVKTAKIQQKDHVSHACDLKGRLLVGAAVGTGSDLEERIQLLTQAGVDVIVVDSGHGFTEFIINAVKKIKMLTDLPVMAGNIATQEGAEALIEAGADILRVGMGPGSICTTRVVTGMGVPQLTAITETCKAAEKKGVPVIADGGIKQIGDIAKALAAGARAVMLGSLFAGYTESPGEIVILNGDEYKQYRGMGSISAMKKGGAERYGQERTADKNKMVAEGVESLVKCKGNVSDFLFQIDGGLRSSFYYIGGKTYDEFVEKARFVRITSSSLIESHPHSVVIVDPGASYMS